MRQKRVRPMPTEEEKARAKLKAASMDPLVWAMNNVDAAFPDSRGVDAAPMDVEDLDEYDDDFDDTEAPVITATPATSKPAEIQAEGKTAIPASEGTITMEVTPMRQDVSDVSPEEVSAKRTEEKEPEVKKTRKLFKKKEKKSEKTSEVKENKEAEKTEKTEKTEKSEKKFDFLAKFKGFDSTQKKMMVAVGMMSVATVAAVVFGIVSVVKQGETTAELTNQIVAAQNNANIAAQNDAVDGDYINLKDWGLRIKVVTGLTYISYNYESDEYSEVMIWGAKRDASANYSPEFVNQSKNSSSMGTVVRVPRYERAAAGRLIWYDDYYNYYYQGPSGVPNVSEDEMSWWVDSYLLIKEMLTNADNYEKYEQNTIGQS